MLEVENARNEQVKRISNTFRQSVPKLKLQSYISTSIKLPKVKSPVQSPQNSQRGALNSIFTPNSPGISEKSNISQIIQSQNYQDRFRNADAIRSTIGTPASLFPMSIRNTVNLFSSSLETFDTSQSI